MYASDLLCLVLPPMIISSEGKVKVRGLSCFLGGVENLGEDRHPSRKVLLRKPLLLSWRILLVV